MLFVWYSTEFVTAGKLTRSTILPRFNIFRLRSKQHKDCFVCRIVKYDLHVHEGINIPVPPPVLLNWTPRSCVFSLWHVFLYFFPSSPLVVCLSTAASAPGPAPLSRCPWPHGFTSPPFWPSATRNPTGPQHWLGPAGSGSPGKSATLASEGWKKPPWPRAPR